MKNRRKNKAKKKLLAAKEKEETDPSKLENRDVNINASNDINSTLQLHVNSNISLGMKSEYSYLNNQFQTIINKKNSLIQWGNVKLSKNIQSMKNIICHLNFEINHLINQITFIFDLTKSKKEIIAL